MLVVEPNKHNPHNWPNPLLVKSGKMLTLWMPTEEGCQTFFNCSTRNSFDLLDPFDQIWPNLMLIQGGECARLSSPWVHTTRVWQVIWILPLLFRSFYSSSSWDSCDGFTHLKVHTTRVLNVLGLKQFTLPACCGSYATHMLLSYMTSFTFIWHAHPWYSVIQTKWLTWLMALE